MNNSPAHLKFLIASKQYAMVRAAGYSLRDARAAGYSLSDARAAGYSLSDARAAGYSLRDALAVPVLEKPYTKLLNAINEKNRTHDQSTYGDWTPGKGSNVCGMPMCTAGHFVSMAGEEGWSLREAHGWDLAYAMLHAAVHPDFPPQDTSAIKQETAIGYIEYMAAIENNATQPQESTP